MPVRVSQMSEFQATLDNVSTIEGQKATLSEADFRQLQQAVSRLEQQSFAMSLATMAGMPIEAFLQALPAVVQSTVSKSVNKALEQCLKVALATMKKSHAQNPHIRTHSVVTAATGAVGGFFGVAGLAVELPVTTTVMLHSIAEIAKSYGEDLSRPENALSCLEVLAFSGGRPKTESMESAYYGTRAALAQATREAATYLSEKGMVKGGVPALVDFLSKIGARFGLEVSEKVAAQAVPIIGALGGLATNVVFISHFQKIAQGHFAIRRLERIYGIDTIRRSYEEVRASLPQK
jgi:hypothetical protein